MGEGNDGLICDKGMFYAGPAILISVQKCKKVFLLVRWVEKDGFKLALQGTGIAVLFSPVPQEEITIVELNDEKLSVDGNFALMRTGGISFKARKKR